MELWKGQQKVLIVAAYGHLISHFYVKHVNYDCS